MESCEIKICPFYNKEMVDDTNCEAGKGVEACPLRIYIHDLEGRVSSECNTVLCESASSQQTVQNCDLSDQPDYDCGLINDYGGGNVSWWMDYLRTEINRCNEYWRSFISSFDT